MDEHFTLEDISPVEKELDSELQDYISTFVQTWEERQKSLTLNTAAIEKAKREWLAEQNKARQEARTKTLSDRLAN